MKKGKWVTISEASRILGITTQAVRSRIKNKTIPEREIEGKPLKQVFITPTK